MEVEDNVVDLKKEGDMPKVSEGGRGLNKGLVKTISIIAILFSVIAFIGVVVLMVQGPQYRERISSLESVQAGNGERLSTMESVQDGMAKMVILNDIQTGLLKARIFIEENDFPRAGIEIERLQTILRKKTSTSTEDEKVRFEDLYGSLEELRGEIRKGPSPLTKLFRESQKKAAALLQIP
jgi:hypothetical protein